MFPGSVAGLPELMATTPQLMREAGYRAHMVGKWHLGHAQWKQGPVGREAGLLQTVNHSYPVPTKSLSYCMSPPG